MLHIHFCAYKAHGTDPPKSCAEAHGEQAIVAFYNGMTTSVNKGRATDAIYGPPKNLISKLERNGFKG